MWVCKDHFFFIFLTFRLDKETGRKVLQNKKTGKILRSFQEDWIVDDGVEYHILYLCWLASFMYRRYDSDDLNGDLDSEDEEEPHSGDHFDKKNRLLPAYTKDFIVEG